MQAVSVYLRNEIFWIIATSVTEHRLWVHDGPASVVLMENEPFELGESILAALSRSRQIDTPTSWNTPSPLLRASGSRSWKAFEKNAKLVRVRREEQMAIMPTKRERSGGGFEHLPDKTIHISAGAAPAEVGMAVIQALSLCE